MSPTEIEALRALILEIQGSGPPVAAEPGQAFDLRAYLNTHRAEIGDFVANANSGEAHPAR